MSRGMWILAALFAAIALAAIWKEEFGGGIQQPWAECKESLVEQLFSNTCTPRAGLQRPPAN